MLYKDLKSESIFLRVIYIIVSVVIVALFTSIVFWPINFVSFSAPDDRWMLLKHTNVHPVEFTFGYLYRIFTSFNDIQYSPLNTLYYYFIYLINGYDPYYYHLFSLIIHLVNTFLVFKLCRTLLKIFDVRNYNIIGYLICLIWSILPLNVEAVVWISASKVILFSFFSLLSFLFFLKGIQTIKLKYYVCSVIFFLFACFCKEQSIVNPCMYVLFILCLVRNNRKCNFRYITSCIVCMLFISVVFGIISIIANSSGTIEFTPMSEYPFWQRIMLSFYCLSFYLTNLVIPNHLHYHYPFPINPGEWMPITFYIYPILFAVFCTFLVRVLWQSSFRYFYIFSVGMFFIQIGLVLQILPMTRPAIMADRYMYLPSIALLLIIMPVIFNDVYCNLKKIFYRYLAFFLLVIYVVCLTTYSNLLAFNWTKINLIHYGH